MSASAPPKSQIQDSSGARREAGQENKSGKRDYASEFGQRLIHAAGRTPLATIARKIDVPTQTLHTWSKGKSVPGGDRLFLLADALGVLPRWLAMGEGPERLTEASDSDAGTVSLPLFDLFAFTPEERPEPVEHVPLPRTLLSRISRGGGDLWLAEMPTDLPNVANEGDTVVLRDPDAPLVDGRVYALLLDGRLIVRRVSVRPEGLTLRGGLDSDPILLSPDQLERVVPIGRIMAAINLTPI